MPTFSDAADLLAAVADECDRLDHHPTVSINDARVCHDVSGCGVSIEFTTFAAGATLTDRDFAAATAIEPLVAARAL